MLGQDLQVQLLPACATGIDIGGAEEAGRILGWRFGRHGDFPSFLLLLLLLLLSFQVFLNCFFQTIQVSCA